MELFPAQPDLSLQISPPNAKPTPGSWRRTGTSTTTAEEEVMDLGFWKRALDSRNSSISSSMASKPDHNHHHHHHINNNNNNINSSYSPNSSSSAFELSLSSSINNNSNNNIHHQQYHHLQNGNCNTTSTTPTTSATNANNNNTLFHTNTTFPLHYHHHQNAPFHHHHHPQQVGLSQELGFLRPIRGIPVYQNPPTSAATFPFSPAQPLDHAANSSPSPASLANGVAATSPFQAQLHHHHQGLMRSRFLSRFPAKRSMRAPRMRWTTTLHSRFVHAVELLGGHESMSINHYPLIDSSVILIKQELM